MEFDDLYQDILLDHCRNPRGFREIPDEEAIVDEDNPTCGDHVKMVGRVVGDIVTDVAVECHGCAICTASSSMLTEYANGRSVGEVKQFIGDFTEMIRGEHDMDDDALGDLVALRGVGEYPLRVKCATMVWHALAVVLKRLGH